MTDDLMSHDSALKEGTLVGPYHVEGIIGAGGMGEVYRARDTRLGRSVALKVLLPPFASNPERMARFHHVSGSYTLPPTLSDRRPSRYGTRQS